jgi:hypothetical protein
MSGQAPDQQRIIGPLATIVAPIASLFGYRGRYDEYSGPLD